jgi:hypothetical protein
MKKSSIQLSFTRMTDSNFLTKGNFIHTSMSGNPFFPSPVPTLAEVEGAIALYTTKLLAATGLGRVNVAEKNQARDELERMLYKLGLWVMFMADGVEAVLASSGYTLVKEPQPRTLDKPGDVTLTYDITSGTLISSIPKGNASSFIHEITDAPPTESTAWKSYPASTSQFTFTGLIPGRQYWVRVAVVGSRKQIAYSNIATQFASL